MTKSKQPFLIRILAWFAALASLGMYLSIVLAILDIGPHIMGGETAYNSGEPVCEIPGSPCRALFFCKYAIALKARLAANLRHRSLGSCAKF